MAYPGATIYLMSERGIEPVAYEDTEHYAVTRAFLDPHERAKMLEELFADDDE
jgi:predicted ATPase